MSETELRRNPVEELAEDFLKRYRAGQRPSISEYARQHPELADDIYDLFPSLAMMEEAGGFSATGDEPTPPPDRLGDYRILREVGRGGMGVVYEAVQESLGRHVALKVLPPEASRDSVRVGRFRHEACSAARLHHTNIVPVFEVGRYRGTNFYAMQFIQGQSLDEVMYELRRLRAERHSVNVKQGASGKHEPDDLKKPPHPLSAKLASALSEGGFQRALDETSGWSPPPDDAPPGTQPVQGSMPPPDNSTDAAKFSPSKTSELTSQSDFHYYRSVARIGVQVADALAYAHAQKVLHRDIKPSNLLLDLQGTAWVTDFGLAKEEGDDLTKTGDLVGTLRFMAPERLRGEADVRSDVYSLGLTLYEMLTLRPAFDEADRGRLIRQIAQLDPVRPRAIDEHVPRDMETIVLKSIAKEPAVRYQTAADMADDLRRFLSDRPIQARRSSTWEQTWRWCRRNPLVARLAAAVVLLLASVATISSLAAWRLRDEREAMKKQLLLTHKAETVAAQRAEEIKLAAERQNSADVLLQSARILADFRRWREAHEAFNQVVSLLPDSSGAHYERGAFYARLALWDLAASDFDDGFRLRQPDHPRYWFTHALLRAYVNDERGYRQARQRLREQFREAPIAIWDNELARACTLMPWTDDEHEWPVEVARRSVELEPNASYAHYSLGWALYNTGAYEEALGEFRESLRFDSRWCLAHTGIALCQHRMGQADEAHESLVRASQALDEAHELAVRQRPAWTALFVWHDWLEWVVRIRDASLAIDGRAPPEDGRLFVVRARALAAIGESPLAEAACRQALALRPDDSAVELACAEILAELGVPRADRDEGPKLEPSSANERQRGLAAFAALAKRGQWDRAIEQWKSLTRQWPDDAALQLACGDAFVRHQRWTDAAAAYTVVVELSDDSVTNEAKCAALMGRARACAQAGHHQLAIDDLTAALERVADDSKRAASLLIERADQYDAMGNHERELADMELALVLDPDAPPPYWSKRGVLHAKLSHWNEALADFSRAIDRDKNDWWLWAWRGVANRELQNWDASIADLSRAIELYPADPGTFENRGFAHAARRDWQEAVADFSRAAELDPKNVWPLLRRARALVHLDRFSEATSDFAKFLEAHPDDACVWFELATANAKRRALADARAAYDRGIAIVEKQGSVDPTRQRLREEAETALAYATRGEEESPPPPRDQ